jgi:hypothetical protein
MSLKFSFTTVNVYAFIITALMCCISLPLAYSVRRINSGDPHYTIFFQNSVSSYFSGKGLSVSCFRTPSNALFFPSYELKKTKKHSVAWVCERTIPTERPPLVENVSAKFCGQRVPRGQRDGSLRQYSHLSWQEPLFFLSSSSSIVLTRLSGPRSRPTASQKIC